jgi:hypothetical protein
MGEPVGVAGLGFGHGPLSLPDHLSPQISGELQPDLDPCGVYRDGVQHHRVEAPSAEEDPQPQVEVVESTELESAHPPLAVYDNYIEHDLYSFIPLLFCTEQTKEEEVLVEDPYAEEDLQPQAEVVESFESESAPPVVYDRYDEPNHDEIAEVLALLEYNEGTSSATVLVDYTTTSMSPTKCSTMDFSDADSARTCDVTDVPIVHSALKAFVKMLNGGSEHPQEVTQTSIARCARISACDTHQPTTSMSWLHTRVHRSVQTPSLRGVIGIA